jgi:hypothetical protein
MLPIYFVRRTTISNRTWLIIFAGIILFLSPVVLIYWLDKFEAFVPKLYFKPLVGYINKVHLEGMQGLMNVGNVVHILFLLLCLFFRKKFIANFKHAEILFGYLMIFFIFDFATMCAGSVSRVSLYFELFFLIILASILSIKHTIRQFLFGFVVLYIMLSMGKKIVVTQCYYPYTNFIIYYIQK